MKYKYFISFLLTILSASYVYSQEDTIFSTNKSLQIGIGTTSILDTYLSPLRYNGIDFRLLGESNRMSRHLDGRLSIQNRIDVSFASTENPAGNGTEYALFADWNWGYHYRFPVKQNFTLMAGGLTYVSAGAIYNLRNGNNPVSAKIGMGLAASGMGLYNFKIKEQPLTARLQVIIPFAGLMFSPKFGQSYYDLFGLGNYDNNIHFSSWHNLFPCKTTLSLDIPLNNFTLRASYQNNIYISNVNDLKTEMYSHTFLIGFVTEVISLSGKKQRANFSNIKSAYY